MRCFILALALLGAAVTATHAQDAILNLKGTWSGKGKTIVFGNNRYHPGSQTTTSPPRVRDIEFDLRRRWSRRPARLGPFVILSGRHQGAIRLDDCERQQDDRRCRYGRPFSHHSHLARPHREVPHPKRHEPKQIDRCHLPHDGSGETVVIVARANAARRLVSVKSAGGDTQSLFPS